MATSPTEPGPSGGPLSDPDGAINSRLLPLEPMDPGLTWEQPGGGVIVHLELAWGHVRRWWLRAFRRGYVERMRRLRKGTENRCPHEVLDPRDLKFFRNQGGYWWDKADDPFTWRDRLPFTRTGLAELFVFSLIFYGGGAGLAWWLVSRETGRVVGAIGWLLVATLLVIGGLITWFFRNPQRDIPQGRGTVVSPADGVITTIDEIEHDEFVGGPAVLIGIFLSIFNVHINRSPLPGRVIGVRYKKGKYLNALRPESARENEQLALRMQMTQAPYRRFVVRQITGAIARRIVCWMKPGDELTAGEQFGMIKLGSRTELVLPREAALELKIKLGDTVQAGSSILATYRE
ncbi:phosphatidylserine decarboxylase [Caulifigura coniformis]|uniref:Phosphatidylserine decarboxylase n=1 Tax=Caulifigura coniformis TaxID=2527983 RepID=A0A517SG08_9PLAN|nr:phosphatidylserine decarboxylase [Caulifigura coniformis]QDT55061.1 phosphatidylserine decarboxylase [Caulifigura coniformis]